MFELPLWDAYSRLGQWFPSNYVKGTELAFSLVLEIHSEVELRVVKDATHVCCHGVLKNRESRSAKHTPPCIANTTTKLPLTRLQQLDPTCLANSKVKLENGIML